MSKNKQGLFSIFVEAIGLYFSNFDKFLKYMTFPVLGQILGLSLILIITYFYALNLPHLIDKYSCLNNLLTLSIFSILLILPGLAILIKALWEYLVAYGAINSMYENMKKSGRVYDFLAHTELVKRRSFTFIGLWFLFGLFSLLAILPPFWIICGIFAVYFVLAFQAFIFEQDLSPFGCLKKSFNLIKGKFAQTFILMLMAGLLTYLLIPQIFIKLVDYGNILNIISSIFIPVINLVPTELLQNLTSIISKEQIALVITKSLVAQIFIAYTLPLRSILWSLWYKKLEKSKLNKTENFANKSKKTKKSAKKRPSEILMENSHKKFTSKKLDKNIIRRASEKDEN